MTQLRTMGWELPLETTPTLRDYALQVAVRNGAPRDLAEDIAQITLLRLNEAAARNPGVLALLGAPTWRSYVAASTRNVLAGHHRSESRRLRREESDSASQERLAAETRELDELLAAMMIEQLAAHLSREEQLFVHLRYFQGKRLREIAEELGMTEARLSHVGRGTIKKLETLLKPKNDLERAD